jgi:outer membrane murein-binding lipoprotein Lpp
MTPMQQSDHLVIQGDFLPPERERLLKTTMRVFVILLAIAIMAALLVYGFRVHYESGINRLARETRELNEQNKELQVKLNQLRSYKNVESAAAHVPHLRMPDIVLTVHAPKPASSSMPETLPSTSQSTQDFPRVYGY